MCGATELGGPTHPRPPDPSRPRVRPAAPCDHEPTGHRTTERQDAHPAPTGTRARGGDGSAYCGARNSPRRARAHIAQSGRASIADDTNRCQPAIAWSLWVGSCVVVLPRGWRRDGVFGCSLRGLARSRCAGLGSGGPTRARGTTTMSAGPITSTATASAVGTSAVAAAKPRAAVAGSSTVLGSGKVRVSVTVEREEGEGLPTAPRRTRSAPRRSRSARARVRARWPGGPSRSGPRPRPPRS